MRYAGKIEQHPETWLVDRSASALLVRQRPARRRAGARARVPGRLPLPRGHVRRDAARDRPARRADRPRRCSALCFDSGPHGVRRRRSGGACCGSYGELVGHVHLKDVDRNAMDAVYASGGGLRRGVGRGVFCRSARATPRSRRASPSSRRLRLLGLARGRAGPRAAAGRARERRGRPAAEPGVPGRTRPLGSPGEQVHPRPPLGLALVAAADPLGQAGARLLGQEPVDREADPLPVGVVDHDQRFGAR